MDDHIGRSAPKMRFSIVQQVGHSFEDRVALSLSLNEPLPKKSHAFNIALEEVVHVCGKGGEERDVS